MKKLFVAFALCVAFAFASAAFAGEGQALRDFDWLEFAKTDILRDLHPTAKPEEATAEFDKQPAQISEHTTGARIEVFYKGWMNKHSMKVNVKLMDTDAGKMAFVEVLQDTNSGKNLTGSKLVERWNLLADLGWK